MDESAYRSAQRTANPAPCIFAKALLARALECELSRRVALAEREAVGCASAVARTHCATLANLIRERARFALALPAPDKPISHAQQMKLECGGLSGLARELGRADPDVHRLVQAAQLRWGSLVDIPWAGIVRSVARWQGRRRHTPRPPS